MGSLRPASFLHACTAVVALSLLSRIREYTAVYCTCFGRTFRVRLQVTFGEVSQAAYRIRPGVGRTLMHHSRKMSALLNANVFFKNEFQHPTGSFKERGGRNALMLLSESGAEWRTACQCSHRWVHLHNTDSTSIFTSSRASWAHPVLNCTFRVLTLPPPSFLLPPPSAQALRRRSVA